MRFFEENKVDVLTFQHHLPEICSQPDFIYYSRAFAPTRRPWLFPLLKGGLSQFEICSASEAGGATDSSIPPASRRY
jgi:hypothetical protein